jgi:hypothetical protein
LPNIHDRHTSTTQCFAREATTLRRNGNPKIEEDEDQPKADTGTYQKEFLAVYQSLKDGDRKLQLGQRIPLPNVQEIEEKPGGIYMFNVRTAVLHVVQGW